MSRTTTPRRHASRLMRATAVVAAAAVMLTGCTLFPADPVAPVENTDNTVDYQRTEITIPMLAVSGSTGSIFEQTISVKPSEDGKFSIDISEDEVGGFGDMFQGAAWSSVMVATLLTGADITNNYRFALRGRGDGPSAGGITTAGLLSLILGDEFLPDVVMTGTITPSGTIGPVGGVPEKVTGVVDADGDYTKVLIPAGSRNSMNTQGQVVDVVEYGRKNGLEVVEVGDIFEAYFHLTGKELPAPSAARGLKVTEPGYTRFKTATERQLNDFNRADLEFTALTDGIQEAAWESYIEALIMADEADRLLSQGLPGGAFIEAMNAKSLMQALAGAYGIAQDALINGGGVLDREFSSIGTVERVFTGFLDRLDTFKVKTLSDAEAITTAYGNAFDAFTLYLFASSSIEEIYAALDAGAYGSIEEVINDSLYPLLLLELSVTQVEAAEAIFEVGRDLDSPAISENANVADIASFFRRAADANLEAFTTTEVAPLAENYGYSDQVIKDILSERDIAVALAYTASDTIGMITNYLGKENPNAAYAEMGYGWRNYARNAGLIEKYAQGQMDGDFNIVGVRSDSYLSNALEFSADQVSSSVSVLEGKEYTPVLIVGAFESAGIDREGDLTDKFFAIESNTGSFAMARVLAYLGGFPTEGYRR
ncbi:S16 family serine protease [Cryobacterium sp. BB307]|uniref:S16 family serine protease n=1 Tax=Cryobacterium sp. BB307 TaxID=2716317 RepID=UPI0014487C92|nr:S16 family serine protease [Cryobacterium sp. BB307]